MSAASTVPLVEFPLAMDLATGTLREPAAWFVPGADAGRWIEEMVGWNVSLVDARLYVVPSGINDPRPCGALVILKDGKPSVSAALPYTQIDDRLFFPSEARLDPELSPQEVRAKLLWDVQVLHPAAGLVGFNHEDAVSVEALLTPPQRRTADWSHAEPGIAPRPALTSVLAEALPTMQEILDMGRDDIGSSVEEDLPIAPDESPLRDAIANTINRGLKPLLSALVRLLSTGATNRKPPAKGSSAGKGATPPRPPGALRRWATAKLKQVNDALQERRNRELNRLLKLLQADPDTGLQYALPLRDVASRGVAPPSDSLGRRSVDFNLSRLFAGNRPGDSWAVPVDLQKQLRDRYRETANRELNLGRFSRAAYIFAHLLGDFTAAADALKRGRSFREAAVIYKEQLKNPKAAADCLAAGGLLLEAIPLYRSLELHESAAGLHERLGQLEEARECYREAVALLLDRKDFVAAARLMETKLAEPDAAMNLLASTWPDAKQAGVCLAEWFLMSGRLGRHDDATARVGELSSHPPSSGMYLTLVQNLCSVARGYPNPNVRSRSADCARVLSGNRLVSADPVERRELVSAIVSLVPADELLLRDGNRFLSHEKPKRLALPIPVKGVPSVVRSFRLLGDQWWQKVVALPGGFLAFGTRGLRATMVRGIWDGRMLSDSCHIASGVGNYLMLAPGHGSDGLLASLKPGVDPRIGRLTLPRIDLFQDDLIVDTPAYAGLSCLGACREENGTTWVVRGWDGNEKNLYAHSPGGALLSSHSVSRGELAEGVVIPLPMAARKGAVFIGYGQRLLRYHAESGRSTFAELPFPIHGLTPSPPFTLTRMIAIFDSGCAVVQESGHYQFIALDLIDPVATFTPDGSIIAIGGTRGHVYRRQGEKMAFLNAFEVKRAPIAVLPAGNSEFAVFDSEGHVDIYRLAGD